jgi:pimeloyl-ACP methyl ester carboxylesterase
MTTRVQTVGILLLAVGLITLSLVLLADWIVPGRTPSIGTGQLLGSIPSILTMAIGALLTIGKPFTRAPGRVVVVALGGGLSVFAMVMVSAALERGHEFRYDATTGPSQVLKKVVRQASLTGSRVCRCVPEVRASMTLGGGFETPVSIYDRGGPEPRPGVVVAHGNTWLGSQLSTYRMVASQLAKRGFIVLTFDFPGFGSSADPYGRGASAVAAAMDWPAHLNAAVDYLLANTEVDGSDITVFGHSGGTDAALRAGATNPKVARVVVMFGPTVPTEDAGYVAERGRYFSNRAAEQYRYVYGREIPDWERDLPPRERYTDDIWEHYLRPGHKPLLVVLAERDQPEGHSYLRTTLESYAQPKQLLFLPRSDHYLNTAQTLGFVFYDVAVATQFADGLADWMSSTRPH